MQAFGSVILRDLRRDALIEQARRIGGALQGRAILPCRSLLTGVCRAGRGLGSEGSEQGEDQKKTGGVYRKLEELLSKEMNAVPNARRQIGGSSIFHIKRMGPDRVLTQILS